MAYFSWSVLPGARGVGALRQAGTLSARANSNAEKVGCFFGPLQPAHHFSCSNLCAAESACPILDRGYGDDDEVHQQPGNQYRITVLDPGIQSSTCITLTSKSNGDASVVQLSPFLGSIGGYTKDTADFRKQAGPRLLVLQYRAQHDHSIACVLPAV
ncbi:hypothetical protein GQ600_18726 [Phytophthora cactorum]|nr:hypothetical protein GQ600_18726 [Phytophthora cactorum]